MRPATTIRPQLKRVVAAFVAAPLGGAAAIAVIAFSLVAIGGSPEMAPFVAGQLFALAAIIGYAVALILGIPGFLLLRRFGWVRRAHWVLLCASLGAVAGGIWPVFALIAGYPGSPLGLIGVFILPGMLLGVASGLVFAWVIKVEPPRTQDIAATFD